MLINISQFPKWIRESELFKNFEHEPSSEIDIDKELIKDTPEINNLHEFIKVFNISRYWGMDYPQSFYDWAMKNKKEALDFFQSEIDKKDVEELSEELRNSESFEWKIFPCGVLLCHTFVPTYYLYMKFPSKNNLNIQFQNIDGRGIFNLSNSVNFIYYPMKILDSLINGEDFFYYSNEWTSVSRSKNDLIKTLSFFGETKIKSEKLLTFNKFNSTVIKEELIKIRSLIEKIPFFNLENSEYSILIGDRLHKKLYIKDVFDLTGYAGFLSDLEIYREIEKFTNPYISCKVGF